MKNKNTGLKIMLVLALILSITGLSLGFANYASNLKIESSAKYSFDQDTQSPWSVSFMEYFTENETGLFQIFDTADDTKLTVHENNSYGSPYYCTDDYTDIDSIDFTYRRDYNQCEDVEATDAIYDGLNVKNIEVTFKNLSSAVIYYLPVGNFGLIDAYLKSITFSGNVTCSSDSETMKQDALDAICDNIDLIYVYDGVKYTNSVNNISQNNKLESGYGVNTKLYIGIKATEENLKNIAVGEINVTIPDITLNYSSVN